MILGVEKLEMVGQKIDHWEKHRMSIDLDTKISSDGYIQIGLISLEFSIDSACIEILLQSWPFLVYPLTERGKKTKHRMLITFSFVLCQFALAWQSMEPFFLNRVACVSLVQLFSFILQPPPCSRAQPFFYIRLTVHLIILFKSSFFFYLLKPIIFFILFAISPIILSHYFMTARMHKSIFFPQIYIYKYFFMLFALSIRSMYGVHLYARSDGIEGTNKKKISAIFVFWKLAHLICWQLLTNTKDHVSLMQRERLTVRSSNESCASVCVH